MRDGSEYRSECVPEGSGGDLVCYLMRGLPSTGKSYTARRLAGSAGIVCETDAFMRAEGGGDLTRQHDDADRLVQARERNFARFCEAIDSLASPVVVDRGNANSAETRCYARYALDRGYRVELAEPESPWWAEIRVLLKYREHTAPVLEAWAERLAELSQATHRVSAARIWSQMQSWRYGLTVAEILQAGSAEAGPVGDAARGEAGTAAVIEEGDRSREHAELALELPRRPVGGASRPGEHWFRDLLADDFDAHDGSA